MRLKINQKPEDTLTSPLFHFHVNKKSRQKYVIEDSLFSIKGRVIFANFNAVKILAEKMNAAREADSEKSGVSPSLLNAMGLMDEILHFMIGTYKQSLMNSFAENILTRIKSSYGEKDLEKLLTKFTNLFPNNEVFNKKISELAYLSATTEGINNKEIQIEEMLVQWVQNQNKAYETVNELIDDSELKKSTIFEEAFDDLKLFFEDQPRQTGSDISFLEMLLLPSKLHPDSIYDQLSYIKENWGAEIGDFISRILISLDFFKEEAKKYVPGMFGKENYAVSYSDDMYDFEPEAFSADLDWMPHLVMIAKSTYVWLDQLSRQYKISITRLDQIPDEELNRLANFGFTGLWLIGLWERSTASQRIKQINGNPEAVASAYSLKNYDIAQDIGGFAAYEDLKSRAWQRGIRLASDMVPNHMAIDSDWVKNHPHWFLQNDHPHFPSHTFNGQDLTDDDQMGIYIEDGYWQKSDASVSFKRVDKNTGRAVYIYHGNDGTGMPWNDTAQLNYMMPEVREAVIQTILHVAHLFPVIRFDAAMTLAKKHYQRLWFPEPGTGGDIPTRAEHAMTKEQFNTYFPEEFWREVVDRVQKECPDTLLLAEAFWMMEGYFVRSLGMHRVYNSAFMNLLKNEENQEYRLIIKNVLEFNPQIMKRYVNFMNNPDEETAVAQFGKEDKYFGVCMLMCTMPGLPMFGHGQIEGYAEKYGMEYKKAYWDETIDEHLVNRHRREIFPVLKKRKLFSEVDNFRFYNFVVNNSHVNENVYVYSNMFHEDRSIVLYNNAYQHTAGWFKDSLNYKGNDGNLVSKSLARSLNLKNDQFTYTVFYDHITGLEYLRKNSEIIEKGLFAELGGYKYQVFLNIREVISSSDNPYDQLFQNLSGKGVTSIEESLHALKIEPITKLLRIYYAASEKMSGLLLDKYNAKKADKIIDDINNTKKEIYKIIDISTIKLEEKLFHEHLKNICELKSLLKDNSFNKKTDTFLKKGLVDTDGSFRKKLNYFFYIYLNQYLLDSMGLNNTGAYFDYWLLQKTIADSVSFSEDEFQALKLISCYESLSLLVNSNALELADRKIFDIPELKRFLKINQFDKVVYFNKERWSLLIEQLTIFSIIQFFCLKTNKTQKSKFLSKTIKRNELLNAMAAETGYVLEKLVLKLQS